MRRLFFSTLFALFIAGAELGYCQETLTMVYRPSGKSPYIEEYPSNKGWYQIVFGEAAKKLGLKFEIERLPKKRAYFHLESGKYDFYPGASFNEQREKIGFFIENCIPISGVILLYRDDITISNVSDIKGYNLLYNMGGTTSFYKYSGIDIESNTVRKVVNLDINKAIKILQAKQGDIYAYDLKAVEYFLKRNSVEGVKSYVTNNDEQIDHLIFSKNSKYYKEKENPLYDPEQKLSINNLPYTLDEESIAYKFQQTLKSMKESGEITKLKQQYFE